MVKKIFFITVSLGVLVFAVIMVKAFKKTTDGREGRVKLANLIIYTHSSFMDTYGPGGELKAAFEKICDCTVEYIDAGGSAVAIEKMKLDPTRRVDLILGLDHLLLSRSARSIKFQDISKPKIPWHPSIDSLIYSRFIPYDWSPMGFIYRVDETKPYNSLKEAMQNLPSQSVSLQDPTLSTPGL